MRTPLFEEHKSLKATMTEFGGWEMPMYYAGIVREVNAVRTTAGIFDLSHMGEFMCTGPDALSLLQSVTTNDLSKVGVGQAQYNLLPNDQGGVIDDLIIYRLAQDVYMPVVNASNIDKDYTWMQEHNSKHVPLDNRSEDTALVAVQGPLAAQILQPLTDVDLASMPRFHIRAGKVAELEALVASTGYTGGPGFEVYCVSQDAAKLWKILLAKGAEVGAEPVGLGARDVLRVEAGYPLYGHELSDEISPVDAGLMWVVKFNKGDFIGKEAIQQVHSVGPSHKLVGLKAIDRCIPRSEYVIKADGVDAGYVTSGTFSPTLQTGIAMAYLAPEYAKTGSRVTMDVRGKDCTLEVVNLPFYKP